MEIILATRNGSKAQQIQAVFADSPITVISLENTNVQGEAYEAEDTTFEANAELKARYVQEQMPGSWVMADDSGICIRAFNGAPGVNTAYWAGRDATQEELTQFVIDQMAPHDDRAATFHTYVVVLSPEGEKFIFDGSVEGSLLRERRVESQPKMPYSALFVPDGQDKCWAEMTTEEENAISHRGKAFRKSRVFLESKV